MSAHDDKRIQSIVSVGVNAYGTSKIIVSMKKENKCNNILRQYKKWLTLTILQRKT